MTVLLAELACKFQCSPRNIASGKSLETKSTWLHTTPQQRSLNELQKRRALLTEGWSYPRLLVGLKVTRALTSVAISFASALHFLATHASSSWQGSCKAASILLISSGLAARTSIVTSIQLLMPHLQPHRGRARLGSYQASELVKTNGVEAEAFSFSLQKLLPCSKTVLIKLRGRGGIAEQKELVNEAAISGCQRNVVSLRAKHLSLGEELILAAGLFCRVTLQPVVVLAIRLNPNLVKRHTVAPIVLAAHNVCPVRPAGPCTGPRETPFTGP